MEHGLTGFVTIDDVITKPIWCEIGMDAFGNYYTYSMYAHGGDSWVRMYDWDLAEVGVSSLFYERLFFIFFHFLNI